MSDPIDIKDIRPAWLDVIRRLQSAARRNHRGYAVLNIRILVNPNGNPVLLKGQPLLWTEPEVIKLEPQSAETVGLIDRLCGEPR